MKRKPKTLSVQQLAHQIGDEQVASQQCDVSLEISREWSLPCNHGLQLKTVEELVTLHGRVCRLIPDDIGFILTFENGGVSGQIAYEDGPHAGFGMPFPVPLDRHLISELDCFDWDEFRSAAIRATQYQDKAGDIAASMPSKLPPMEIIQRDFAGPIAQFAGDAKLASHAYALLCVGEPDEDDLATGALEFQVSVYKSLDQLTFDMGDLMACSYIVVAIMKNGMLLSADEVQRIRQEVIESLGPISRAKAEGRFWDATSMMGSPF